MGTDREHEQKRSTARAAGPVVGGKTSNRADGDRADGDRADGENTVVLVGRVSAAPDLRELPSGDALVTFRLVVPRAGRRASGAQNRATTERTTVDVIDVACWTGRTRRSALRLEAGDLARVEGSLRRRFFRTGGSTASRYEVEAASVRTSRSTGRSTRSGLQSAPG
ncbi:MAG: single-stranded DNA-binding protein [Dermatophilaceae bacterium]